MSERDQVREFHQAMGLPCPDRPVRLDAHQAVLRHSLMREELDEFSRAWGRGDYFGQIDALVDLLYVTYGSAVEMGVDLKPFFAEVHRANMEKVPPEDGGKCIKPEGWQAPDIAGVYRSAYGEESQP